MRPEKILFFKPGAIGDILHTLPSLKALRRAYPAARITMVVSPGFDQLIQGTSLADCIIVYDKARLKASGVFFAFVRQLRRDGYDLFVDMQPSVRSRILRVLSGARQSLVYQKEKTARQGRVRMHAAENFMRTLAPLGISEPVDRIELPLREDTFDTVEKFLSAEGIGNDKRLIALNCSVGAARPSRNWFPERFSQLADRVIGELGAHVVFVGGTEDRTLVEGVLAGMRHRAFSAAGRLSLAETAALLARCSCLVSSDTGPLHLATSVQTSVVGLYGSTDPHRTGPIGPNHRVVRKDLACVPCEQKICPLSSRECMSAISVDDVLSSVKDVLQCK